jgi:hypothetical protein
MRSEDQYVERTPDFVAKVRAMREAADKAMNRFTRVADYDVRRVVGQGAKPSPVSSETVSPSLTGDRVKRPAAKTAGQTSIEFAPAPAERGEDGEGA